MSSQKYQTLGDEFIFPLTKYLGTWQTLTNKFQLHNCWRCSYSNFRAHTTTRVFSWPHASPLPSRRRESKSAPLSCLRPRRRRGPAAGTLPAFWTRTACAAAGARPRCPRWACCSRARRGASRTWRRCAASACRGTWAARPWSRHTHRRRRTRTGGLYYSGASCRRPASAWSLDQIPHCHTLILLPADRYNPDEWWQRTRIYL